MILRNPWDVEIKLEVLVAGAGDEFAGQLTIGPHASVDLTNYQRALHAWNAEMMGQHVGPRPVRHNKLTPELLDEVARVYCNGGSAPTEAVKEHFNVSKATASRWVKTARDEGRL